MSVLAKRCFPRGVGHAGFQKARFVDQASGTHYFKGFGVSRWKVFMSRGYWLWQRCSLFGQKTHAFLTYFAFVGLDVSKRAEILKEC
jgi:hypothetical protein